MIWANFTWGTPWSNDPKQNASAVGLLLYLSYIILRNSFNDIKKKARISAVYNIFAFFIFIPLIFVLPRLTDSLHPGNGGNPGFNAYDLDYKLRLVFYPSILGWFLLGVWISKSVSDFFLLKRFIK
jgi:heme exporter protein C